MADTGKGRFWDLWAHCYIFRQIRKGTREGLVLRAAVSTFEFKGLQDREQFEVVWKEPGESYDIFAKQTLTGQELSQVITEEFVKGPPQLLTPPLVEFLLLPLQKENWDVPKDVYIKMVQRVKGANNKLVPLIWARGRGSKQRKAAAAVAAETAKAKAAAAGKAKQQPAQKRKRSEQEQQQETQEPSSKAKTAQQQGSRKEAAQKVAKRKGGKAGQEDDKEVQKPAAKKQRKQQVQPDEQKEQPKAAAKKVSAGAKALGKPHAGQAKGKPAHDAPKTQQKKSASKPKKQLQQQQHVSSGTEGDVGGKQLSRGVAAAAATAAAAAGSTSPCKGHSKAAAKLQKDKGQEPVNVSTATTKAVSTSSKARKQRT